MENIYNGLELKLKVFALDDPVVRYKIRLK